MPGKSTKPRVLILYNQTAEDEYRPLRNVDPSTLGFTPEYPIGVATAEEEYRAIARALRGEGFAVRLLNVQDDLRLLEAALRRTPDVVFNLLEHFHERSDMEPMVAGLLELFRIAYTGAPPFALGLCRRKGLTKQLLLANGIPTPRYRLLKRPAIPRRHGLKYPLIVKPAREDASAGVTRDSVVRDHGSLLAQIQKVFSEFPMPVLVEEFIEGRELHVAVLGNDPPTVLPIIEFDFSELPPDHPWIISYDAKWDPLKEEYHRVHSVCPAKLPGRIQKRVEQIAVRAFQLTGCRDYARLDLRIGSGGRAYVLEVNPNPDLTEGVSFMESAERAGMTFSRTLKRIVELALRRRPA